MKTKVLTLLFVLFCGSLFGRENEIILIKGSQIYNRVFLFSFPIAKKYESNVRLTGDTLVAEIKIDRDNVFKEPMTPPLFETDFIIRIKNIPLDKTGEYNLPVTLRCNKMVRFKTIRLAVIHVENVIVLKGVLAELKVGDLANNPYFENRFEWEYPLYFDLRLQLPGSPWEK